MAAGSSMYHGNLFKPGVMGLNRGDLQKSCPPGLHQGMKLHGKAGSNISSLSDDEEAVHSGSATGFSDVERDPESHATKPMKRAQNLFDPVTTILDKIDAELVSLTRSQSSTATDSTVVKRPSSHMSSDHGRRDGSDLSISQLTTHRANFSPHSSDRDTGLGTGASSFQSDTFPVKRSGSPAHRMGSSEFSTGASSVSFQQSEYDDKTKSREQVESSMEARQVDDKFREIMQKRKGFLDHLRVKGSDTEDAQTIRTEDFVEKFGDTLVYSSDEAEKMKNVDTDLSDGGSDTDTLQQKLATLTRTTLPDGLPISPRPVSIKTLSFEPQQPRRRLMPSVETNGMKGLPGTPPVYPKPTPPPLYPKPTQTTLPRPATRSPIKLTAGQTSDAESVMTEDFESNFNDMMLPESDADNPINDPIHTRVKELLKATAKYKPKTEPYNKQKQRVKISPPQDEQHDKGDDSDNTLCSDKEDGGTKRYSTADRKIEDGANMEATRQEIARESDRIRQEMEQERRSKTVSPLRDRDRSRSPMRTYLTLTHTPKVQRSREPEKSHSSRKTLSDEEKERTAELRATHDALDITQTALTEARKQLKTTESQCEDARTQLMLSEYKKENTNKELHRMTDEVNRRQKQVAQINSETKSRLDELKQFDSIGFTKEEAIQIIEENEAMKGKLRNVDAVHAERDELIQQLETTKQDLFTEQKKARSKIEELKEDLETVTSQSEQLQTENEEAVKKLHKVETGYKRMEKEKNELVQEKTRLYEEERDKNQSERKEVRKRTTQEMENIREDLIKTNTTATKLQDQLCEKDELNIQLRDQIIELQRKIDSEHSGRGTIMDEHKRTLQTLRKETDHAMVQLRETLFLEKQKTIDGLRTEMEHERRDMNIRADERIKAHIVDQEAIVKSKKDEVSHLVKMIDKMEKDNAIKDAHIQDQINIHVHEAVNREREMSEKERDLVLREERESLQRDHLHEAKMLQEDVAAERRQRETLEMKVKGVKDELEDVRSTNKQMVHEKLIAVARSKELMKQEHQAEMDRITNELKNEYKKEVEKLHDTIRIQESELRQLREDRARFVRQQKDTGTTLDRTERTLVTEINEECRRTSEMLGLNPRKVNINSYHDNGYVSPQPLNHSMTKTPTTAALANLRACNEELRSHVGDLKQEIEVQRSELSQAERDKDDALTNLKRQLEREKRQEMERLKEKLVRGMSTNEYRSLLYSPDNDVTNMRLKQPHMEHQMRQMSDHQQRDIDRLEREINKLTMNQAQPTKLQQGGAPQDDDVSYQKSLAQLQVKVKQLQEENNTLRRGKFSVSASTPDLTQPDLYNMPSHRRFVRSPSPTPTRDQERMASALELRMKDEDLEAQSLMDVQTRSRGVMSHKMMEMSKLQNTLTNQAKELIQLEKAYTQLNHYAKSPRPTRPTLR